MYYVIPNVVMIMSTEQKYHREVVVIPVDFSHGMEIYPALAEQLKDLDIGILGKCNRLGARMG